MSLRATTRATARATAQLTVWQSANFAPEWFRDALSEAGASVPPGPKRRGANRREIVFAVCFIETYLFEWVRRTAGLGNLPKYFPSGGREGIRQKWKRVLKEFYADDLLQQQPDFDGQAWQRFDELVDFRDGLVHAAASWPQTDQQPAHMPSPVPSPEQLDTESHGYAVAIVAELVRQLHRWAGTDPPDWLVDPP